MINLHTNGFRSVCGSPRQPAPSMFICLGDIPNKSRSDHGRARRFCGCRIPVVRPVWTARASLANRPAQPVHLRPAGDLPAQRLEHPRDGPGPRGHDQRLQLVDGLFDRILYMENLPIIEQQGEVQMDASTWPRIRQRRRSCSARGCRSVSSSHGCRDHVRQVAEAPARVVGQHSKRLSARFYDLLEVGMQVFNHSRRR